VDLRKRLTEQLGHISQKEFPLDTSPPKDAPGTTWVQPSLMCEVAFAEITEGGRFRKPSLIRLRPDLEAPASA
jgi:ATP-dependent DNA ligase